MSTDKWLLHLKIGTKQKKKNHMRFNKRRETGRPGCNIHLLLNPPNTPHLNLYSSKFNDHRHNLVASGQIRQKRRPQNVLSGSQAQASEVSKTSAPASQCPQTAVQSSCAKSSELARSTKPNPRQELRSQCSAVN